MLIVLYDHSSCCQRAGSRSCGRTGFGGQRLVVKYSKDSRGCVGGGAVCCGIVCYSTTGGLRFVDFAGLTGFHRLGGAISRFLNGEMGT